MLTRYKIYRGKRPEDDPKPDGICKDIRKHVKHVLAPTRPMVEAYFKDPSDKSWTSLKKDYLELLNNRFKGQKDKFDELAKLATENDVFIGCNCPTQKNPDINRCHTVLALEFMKERYPDLMIEFPVNYRRNK